jgi:hypothetical protein
VSRYLVQAMMLYFEINSGMDSIFLSGGNFLIVGVVSALLVSIYNIVYFILQMRSQSA